MLITGSPIGYGFGSCLRSFFLRTDVQATLLSFAFTVAACRVCAPQASSAAVLKLGLTTSLSAGFGAAVMWFGELTQASILCLKGTQPYNGRRSPTPVVITMNPSDSFTKERFLWQSNAKTIRKGVAVLFAMVCAANVLVTVPNNALSVATTLAALMPAAARFYEGWRRWTNMYRGTWCAESPFLCLNKPKTPIAPPSLKM